MLAGVGCSDEEDSRKAARLAAEQAINQSGNPDITFLFTTDNYDQKVVLDTVKDICGSKLVGASTPGIIVGKSVLRKGIGVCTIKGVNAATHLQEGISSWKDGRAAGQSLRDQIDSGTVFAFPDGFADNISDVLRGLYGPIGPDFAYFGGGSGDNLKFLKTYQFTENGVRSNSMAVAAIKGMKFSAGVGHGWKSMENLMVVTRANGKIVYEIDGKRAFDVYSELLSGINKEEFHIYGMKHPIGLPCTSCGFLIRDPIEVGPDGSIVFVTEVPQNSVITLMESDVNELISTAEDVARLAAEGVKSPEIVLIFDCVSRYILLGEKFADELRVIHNALDVPTFGMLTFGEVYGFQGVPLFHNKTVVVAVGGK